MKTILVVDDEVDLAETLQSYLALEGYDVAVAFDGREAMHAILEKTPDLIITDLMMPRMNGIELIEQLRATPGLDQVPVIAISAVHRPLDVPLFRKPFHPDALLAEVRRILGEG